jgi:hypothetical protein
MTLNTFIQQLINSQETLEEYLAKRKRVVEDYERRTGTKIDLGNPRAAYEEKQFQLSDHDQELKGSLLDKATILLSNTSFTSNGVGMIRFNEQEEIYQEDGYVHLGFVDGNDIMTLAIDQHSGECVILDDETGGPAYYAAESFESFLHFLPLYNAAEVNFLYRNRRPSPALFEEIVAALGGEKYARFADELLYTINEGVSFL